MQCMMSHLVFVYGTLRRGHPNHYVLTDAQHGKALFICEAKTVEKWPLVIATKFNIPFMLYKPGHGHHVIGELYQVDDDMLQFLDDFEDSPSWYQRRKMFTTGQSTNATSKNESVNDQLHAGASAPKAEEDSRLWDQSSGKEIECWFYVLVDYKDDLVEKEFFADYNVAVEQYFYDKEKEETEDSRLEYSKSVTLKD